VDLADGGLTAVTNSTDLISSLGIRFNNNNSIFYVANSLFPPNGSAPRQGGVGAYHANGDQIFYVDLTHIANDGLPRLINDILIIGEDLYVTESVQGVIYKINSSLGVEVWSENVLYKDLNTSTFPVGINGLDRFESKDYILAVRTGFGVANYSALFKIPLADPNNPFQVPIHNGEFLTNADGARFDTNGDLYVVGNGAPANKVFQVHSDDDFATAAIVGTGQVPHISPTSIVILSGEVYVVTADGLSTGGSYYLEHVTITPVASSSTATTGTGTAETATGGDGTGSSAAMRLSSWLC